jgi:hypothetical protein
MEIIMSAKKLFAGAVVVAGFATVLGAIAWAADVTPASPTGEEIKLPPGWTMEDMQACIIAGTPGEMHERLANEVGTWKGKSTMWMAPGAEPVESEVTSTVSPIMDGRYVKVEWKGDMPGMGPYDGFGIYGFDNVSQEFVAIWIDNHSTGIMKGTGQQSEDGKTITWSYTHNCPLTKKPAHMRDVEKVTGPNSKTLEMFGEDPKSGKEFKMMQVELTKN